MLQRHRHTAALLTLAASLTFAPASHADGGGTQFAPKPPPAPPPVIGSASINLAGKAVPAPGTPREVRHLITAANRLVLKPYRWGGGHRPFTRGVDSAYDCSGAVSYALFGGRLLLSPLDSSGLVRWGEPGPGRWVSVYANRGHAYLTVAGLRFDTADHDVTAPKGTGPRWSIRPRSGKKFVIRHPAGF
jgi:hypothetical protein